MTFDGTAELKTALRKDHADLRAHIDPIIGSVTALWSTPFLYWFTDHGPKHSRRTADLALQIAQFSGIGDRVKLNPVEQFVLWAAAGCTTSACSHFARSGRRAP